MWRDVRVKFCYFTRHLTILSFQLSTQRDSVISSTIFCFALTLLGGFYLLPIAKCPTGRGASWINEYEWSAIIFIRAMINRLRMFKRICFKKER